MSYTNGLDDPSAYFQTVLWSGDSSSPRTITFDGNSDLQPDWIWSKKRSGADYGQIYDSVRGFGASKEIVPSDNFEEGNATNSSVGLGFISSVTSDGFVLTEGNHGTSSIRSLLNNHSGSTHVAWGWKAGGSASSNSNGSITSSVSANTTAGFSIVSFTGNGSAGATVGHGLSAIPKFILVKVHTSSTLYDWRVFHASLGATKNLILNDTSAVATATNKWNDTEPTSSVFSLGNTAGTNESGSGIIAYCFAEKKGYSKFGSYIGGSDPFVYLGFKPAFVMFKNSSAVENWRIVDNKRDVDNPVVQHLYPNLSAAEGSGASYNDFVDFLSNGFKIRSGSGEIDGSGNTIIYMAFAESPFTTSTGIPTTAR
jgi:hypothetical protein